ncbi:MAG: hypothetical protein ABI574_12295 [Burkholderiales bacterium]
MTPEQIDSLLFGLLAERGIAKPWAASSSPREELSLECRQLMSDESFRDELSRYLAANPVIGQSIETVLAQLAFSAGVKSRPSNPLLEQLAHRGQHLSRWLPTFLLIDGPLGRLLRQKPSPLAIRLGSAHAQNPLFASARDAFNNDLFRKVRNGFAHWSFTWRAVGTSAQIAVFHFESGRQEAEISLLEAEALHYLSASVIRALDQEILRKLIRSND